MVVVYMEIEPKNVNHNHNHNWPLLEMTLQYTFVEMFLMTVAKFLCTYAARSSGRTPVVPWPNRMITPPLRLKELGFSDKTFLDDTVVSQSPKPALEIALQTCRMCLCLIFPSWEPAVLLQCNSPSWVEFSTLQLSRRANIGALSVCTERSHGRKG